MKTKTKKIFRKIHLWLGLTSGLVVFVVALTGSILVFEDEIKEITQSEFHKIKPQPDRLLLDSLITNVKNEGKKVRINSIVAELNDPEKPVLFSAKIDKETMSLAVNPYTGKIVGIKDPEKDIFKTILKLHRYLCMGKTGKFITGICTIMFLSLIVSGLILWWPNNKRTLKQRLKIGWTQKKKRLNWDLHAVSGFYISIVIFIIAATGLVWSYKAVNNAIFLVFDGKQQKKYTIPKNTIKMEPGSGFFEKILSVTNQKLPHNGPVTIAIPAKDEQPITISKLNTDAAVTNVVDFLYIEKGTGKLIGDRLYKYETRGMKVRRLIYPIHTGNIFGWPTKIIAFVTSFIAAALPITGFIIWLNRKRKKRKNWIAV